MDPHLAIDSADPDLTTDEAAARGFPSGGSVPRDPGVPRATSILRGSGDGAYAAPVITHSCTTNEPCAPGRTVHWKNSAKRPFTWKPALTVARRPV